ncbi:MAG: GNAT family N-acetyltransferase [Ginsengibacter sp.]
MITTERLKLIPFIREHYDAILQNDTVSLGKLLEVETPQNWTEYKDARDAVYALMGFFESLGNDLSWGSYFIVLEKAHKLIGTCGFKGKPDYDNHVEIGYEIHPQFQRRGIGTEAAKALVDFAFAKDIDGIKAHTVREENNSVRILKKLGFNFQAEIELMGEGPLWYWLLLKENNK